MDLKTNHALFLSSYQELKEKRLAFLQLKQPDSWDSLTPEQREEKTSNRFSKEKEAELEYWIFFNNLLRKYRRYKKYLYYLRTAHKSQ